MYDLLRPDMTLIPKPEHGYVVLQKNVPGPTAPAFRLHPMQALLLALHDGATAHAAVDQLLTAVLEMPADAVRVFAAKTRERYRQFLVPAATAGPVTRPLPALTDLIFETTYAFTHRREAAPQTLMWVVTEDCDKRCRYCYKDARWVPDGRARDLSFPLARMLEVIDEAAEIGVTTMILSGGEPFLRPDLITVIGALVKAGIAVIPITKARITGAAMQALAATGLDKLHVSLDAAQPEVVAYITGIETAHAQMTDTLKAARTYGQGVVLRPVMTRRNIAHLPAMVAEGHDLGVRDFIIDIYGETCGRTDPDFALAPDQLTHLQQQRDRLRDRYPDTTFQFNFERDITQDGKGCMEGLRGLTILPDGKVTKCEHRRPETDLEFGDLNHMSLMDCWQSDRLRTVNHAPRAHYAGTICFHCKRFDTCNEVRGRCSLSSLNTHGGMFHPDVYCPLGMFDKKPGKGASRAATAALRAPMPV